MLALLIILILLYIVYTLPSSIRIPIPRFIWNPTPQGRRDRARRAANFYVRSNGPHVGTDSSSHSNHLTDSFSDSSSSDSSSSDSSSCSSDSW